MRAISQLIALLIILGVLIGVVIAVNMIVFGFMNKQKPTIMDLSFTISGAKLEGSTLYIHGVAVPVGKERIRITGFEVYKGNNLVQYTSYRLYTTSELRPGRTYEVLINVYGVSGVNIGDKITVVIHWETITRSHSGISQAMTVVSD